MESLIMHDIGHAVLITTGTLIPGIDPSSPEQIQFRQWNIFD